MSKCNSTTPKPFQNLPSNPELIVWDCDGVLIDSEYLAATVYCHYLRDLGLEIEPHKLFERFPGAADRALLAGLEQVLGVALPRDFLRNVHRGVVTRYMADLQPMPGALDALRNVSKQRRMCVASNSAPALLYTGLLAIDAFELFYPAIFSAADVQRGKPAPDLFLFAAQRMAVAPSSCLVIEDSATGVEAAVKAGMSVIGYCRPERRSSDHQNRLLNAGAHAIVYDLREIPLFLS
ncbi:HAD family phosphatase [Microvirga sp. VF16]|uniref:HAD family hydrolase n=1 Tax=Microvirga sp. VF16 TaxID=2807101 RepID=UPI00193CF9AC|nr:HAD family phosphatase [Microvirga sp. VF16]QRM32381.1 HAD family phosphatase [Microvirga sp. VF16]